MPRVKDPNAPVLAVTTIKVPEALLQRLKKAAKAQNVPLSHYLAAVLTAHCEAPKGPSLEDRVEASGRVSREILTQLYALHFLIRRMPLVFEADTLNMPGMYDEARNRKRTRKEHFYDLLDESEPYGRRMIAEFLS